jgi:protein-L-isoaspartate O-methyltransferase
MKDRTEWVVTRHMRGDGRESTSERAYNGFNVAHHAVHNILASCGTGSRAYDEAVEYQSITIHRRVIKDYEPLLKWQQDEDGRLVVPE